MGVWIIAQVALVVVLAGGGCLAIFRMTDPDPKRYRVSLFTEGVHNKTRPKFRRRAAGDDVLGHGTPEMAGRMAMFTTFQHPDAEHEKNYGADISTLTRLIEEGKL